MKTYNLSVQQTPSGNILALNSKDNIVVSIPLLIPHGSLPTNKYGILDTLNALASNVNALINLVDRME